MRSGIAAQESHVAAALFEFSIQSVQRYKLIYQNNMHFCLVLAIVFSSALLTTAQDLA
jgi:hypothetical protein